MKAVFVLKAKAAAAFIAHRDAHKVAPSIVHAAKVIGRSPLFTANLLGFSAERHPRTFSSLLELSS